MKTCVFTPPHETGILVTHIIPYAGSHDTRLGRESSWPKVPRDPFFFRPLMVKGVLCALIGRAAFLFRGNTTGSPVDCQRDKKFYERGLSWPPSGPRSPGDALDAGHADTPTPHQLTATRRSSPALYSSHPCWLRPRRHAEEQHLAQGPHMVGQPSDHRWRLGLPPLGRAVAMGGCGLRQRQA